MTSDICSDLDERAINDVQAMLRDVCSMAQSIRRLCVLSIEAGNRSEAADLDAAAEALAGQLGWKADAALQRLGDPGCVGTAEEWMMPPNVLESRQAAGSAA